MRYRALALWCGISGLLVAANASAAPVARGGSLTMYTGGVYLDNL